MPSRELRIICFFLTLLWMAILYYMSSQPGRNLPMMFSLQDKLLHVVAYALLSFLALGTIKPGKNGHRIWKVWLIIILAGSYGVTDELHQSLVPNRDASLADLAADIAGGIAGAWLMYFLVRKKYAS